MKISSLHIYPVKSLRAVDIAEGLVEPRGFAGDRRWMLIDANGRFISQREFPKLAQLRAEVSDGTLTVSGPRGSITVAPPQTTPVKVTLWKQEIEGHEAAAEAHRWFSDFLGVPCRLVYQGRLPRAVPGDWAPAGSEASYADGYPFLIANSASLDDLNRRMGRILPMNRFRPNIVIDGAPAWAEDTWKRIRIGDVMLDLVKPCIRCVITTTDQQTGEKESTEPLNTLKSFRLMRQPGLTGVAFGWTAVPASTGTIRAGDVVDIVEAQAPPAFVAAG